MSEVDRPVGDVDREIFTRLYEPLRRFAAVVHPPQVDPDDLLHDALVRVLERTRLRDLDFPEAYFRRTIVNLASNRRRRLAIHVRTMLTLDPPVEHGDRYPSDLADLMRLPPRSRAVLYLSAVEGMSYSEIADVVGCSEGAARMSASRARRRLRTEVAAELWP